MRALLLALGSVILLSPTAVAANASVPLDRATALAVRFWADRDVTGCPAGIEATVRPLSRVDGLGGSCRITIAQRAVVRLEASRKLSPPRARFVAEQFCGLVVHEVGHALGLPHTTEGVMRPDGGRAIPYSCQRWARARRAPSRRGTSMTSRTRRKSAAQLPNAGQPYGVIGVEPARGVAPWRGVRTPRAPAQ